MSDKYTEITSNCGSRVERIPLKNARVGHQYFVEDAARDLHVANPELGENAGTTDPVDPDTGDDVGDGDGDGDETPED